MPEDSVTATGTLHILLLVLQPQARPGLSPRSPVRVQRISLLSAQNVGTVTLRPVVFSKPADPPKDRPTGTGRGPVPSQRLRSFDVVELRPVGIWRRHLWKNWKAISNVFKHSEAAQVLIHQPQCSEKNSQRCPCQAVPFVYLVSLPVRFLGKDSPSFPALPITRKVILWYL